MNGKNLIEFGFATAFLITGCNIRDVFGTVKQDPNLVLGAETQIPWVPPAPSQELNLPPNSVIFEFEEYKRKGLCYPEENIAPYSDWNPTQPGCSP